jgi:hypothetical protein
MYGHRSSELAKVIHEERLIFRNSLPFLFKYGYSVVKHQKTKGAANLIHLESALNRS